jgi:transcriptional regulator with PAS, ATPase and Fis domain
MSDNLSWFEGIACSITVSDSNGKILYMNPKACDTFKKWGGHDLVGKNMFVCHNTLSRQKILTLIENGETNVYTIEKQGVRKLIYQTPWFVDGKVEGMVEFSFEIPVEMPHFKREE